MSQTTFMQPMMQIELNICLF